MKDNNNIEHTHEHDENYVHNHGDEYSDKGCSCCDGGLLEELGHDGHDHHHSNNIVKKMVIGWIFLALAISLEVFAVGNDLILGSVTIEHPLSNFIFLIIVTFVGLDIIINGIKALLKGNIQIEFLMTIATVGAFVLGNGLEGAFLVLLFSLAEYIEDFALDRSKKFLSQLINLNPDLTTVKRDGKEIELKVADLKLGDVVIVKPGDKIPIDGVIIYGSTSVNQASITGESLAVSKGEGSEVYGSTINEEGYIEIKVTKTFKNTIFSKIIELIKESEDKKAKVDVFINRFAKYYTPSIVLITILISLIPPLLFNQPFAMGI
jgi:Cd2+/Zn2+-exporting ATPase